MLASHTFTAASCVSSSVCLDPTFCDRTDFSHLRGALSPGACILFSHKHAVEVKYLCDVFKSTAIAFCYLNDNSKEITIKMIPYKYVLSRGSSPELWNIDRSASSGCFWLCLQHMSCLYSWAYIYCWAAPAVLCVYVCVCVWGWEGWTLEMYKLIWYSFQGD